MTELGLFHPDVGARTPLFVTRGGAACLSDLGAEVGRLERALAQTPTNEMVLVSGGRLEVFVALAAATLTRGTVLLASRREVLDAAATEGRLVVLGGQTAPPSSGLVEHDAHLVVERLLAARLPGDHPLVRLATSGSTGAPVVHTKLACQLLGEAGVLAREFRMKRGSVVLSTVSAGHLYGALFGLCAPLQGGAALVVDVASEPQVFHPEGVLAIGRELGATHLVTLPAHITTLVSARAWFSGQTVISSAARLDPELARALEAESRAEVVDVLGSTETGGIATRRPASGDAWTPLPGVELEFRQDERLAVRAPWSERPEEFEPLPERAIAQPEGKFLYLGRDDGIVKVGGRRVALAELERAALAMVGVTDAVALSVPTRDSRENLLALLVAGPELERSELRDHLAERLPREAMPRRLRLLRALPRDERGKLPRARLLELLDTPGGLQRVAQGGGSSERWVEVSLPSGAERFEGHFVGAPILPAVSQLLDVALPEARDLLTSVLAGGAQAQSEQGASVRLARLSRFKWLEVLAPGDRMRVTVTLADAVATPGQSLRVAVRIERKRRAEAVLVASGMLQFACDTSQPASPPLMPST